VASRHDRVAQAVVRAWSRQGAALLGAEDLLAPGWVVRPGHGERDVAVVAGERVPVRRIRAVLTRRPAVVVEELGAIRSEDRAYVAAEINAFLVAWLSGLPCRVFNRPTPTSLCGPGWTTLQWQAAAARAGLPFEPAPTTPTRTLVVCGSQVLGTRSPSWRARALALAREAGVDLLELHLRRGRLVQAAVCPDLSAAGARAAVLEALLAPGGPAA